MITALGIAFWLFSLILLVRLADGYGLSSSGSRLERFLWIVLLIAALAILLRPHKNLFGGQDAGAYINAGAAFAHNGSLKFTDSMLGQVDPETRPFFLFGHKGYGDTKYNCLTVEDIDRAQIGPRFQPAYPVLMSVFPRFGWSEGMFFVTPVFTLFTAFALAALAQILIRRKYAGLVATTLYVLSPLVVWHGRCSRPELVASFLLVSGMVFFLRSVDDKDGDMSTLLMGAAALALAPFFHITCWFVVLPAAAIGAWICLRGKPLFVIFPGAITVAGFMFIAQSVLVTDHYALSRFIIPFLPYWWIAVLLVALVFSLLLLISRKPESNSDSPRAAGSRVVALLPGLLAVAVYVALYFLAEPIADRQFDEYDFRYFYGTDFRTVVVYLSLPVAILSLAGVGALLWGRGEEKRARIIFALSFIPASCLVGTMYDLFMTRYLLIAVIPLTVIALTSLVMALSGQGKMSWLFAVLLTLGLSTAQLWGRTHFVSVTEYEGVPDFYEQLVDQMPSSNRVVFCEYSRVSAPLEYYFGIPTLSLDNETREDYRPAVRAWEKIMRENPEQTFFFLTPFDPPVSTRFSFAKVWAGKTEYDRIREERYRLPREVRAADISLSLYAMTLGTKPAADVFIRKIDASNMGVRRFSRHRSKAWSLQGIEGSQIPQILPLDLPRLSADDEIIMLWHAENTPGAPPQVSTKGGKSLEMSAWHELAGGWWLQKWLIRSRVKADTLSVVSENGLLWTDCFVKTGGDIHTFNFASSVLWNSGSHEAEFVGRWARSPSGFITPMAGGRDILVLLKAPEESGATVNVTLRSRGDGVSGKRTMSTGVWCWQLWSLDEKIDQEWGWTRLTVNPAWDPQLRGYPDDLGVRIGCIAAIR